MSLIKCSMCGKDISPNAVACPNCGKTANKKYESKDANYEVRLNKCVQKIKIIQALRSVSDVELKEGVHLVDHLPASIMICDTYEKANEIVNILKRADESADISISEYVEQKEQDVTTIRNTEVRCPNCGSTHTHSISMTSKVTSGFLFGLFARNKIVNRWECKMCKCKW